MDDRQWIACFIKYITLSQKRFFEQDALRVKILVQVFIATIYVLWRQELGSFFKGPAIEFKMISGTHLISPLSFKISKRI